MIESDKTPTILEKIVAQRVASFPTRFTEERIRELTEKIKASGKPRHFFEAITADANWTLIAEIKSRSPSRGKLMSESDPATWAKRYERCGAHALSVVTEEDYFGGNMDWIMQAKAASRLPVLRKDFFTTKEDVLESRALGADAILLIAAVLTPDLLKSLVEETLKLGMEPLIEVHNPEEVKRALKTKARVVGINNRNLHDFTVSIETTKKLTPLLSGKTVVSESGIFSSDEIRELHARGVKSFLVGEAILTSENPDQKIAELLGP